MGFREICRGFLSGRVWLVFCEVFVKRYNLVGIKLKYLLIGWSLLIEWFKYCEMCYNVG